MPRKLRMRIGYGIPNQPQPIDWFEKELDELIRQNRKAAAQYLTEPDPFAVRARVKSFIGRSRIMLAQVRARPEIVYALWNARLLGYQQGTMRLHHYWGKAIIAAKRQRDGSRTGAETSREIRADKAQAREEQVLLEAIQTQRRPDARPFSQRSFALIVAGKLNRTDPVPDPPYTMESVRSILRKQHFFE